MSSQKFGFWVVTEIIGETLRYALNTIAVVAPNWLEQIVPDPDWYERYGQRILWKPFALK